MSDIMERIIGWIFFSATAAGILLILFVPIWFILDYQGDRTPDACRVAASTWVGEGGSVRGCSTGRCDVVSAAGCEVVLDCRGSLDPEDNRPVYAERSSAAPVCPGDVRERVVYQ